MNSNKTSPPPVAKWLLKRLLRYEYRCAVVGDFEEIYHEILEEHDRRHALLWYWCQIIKSTPSFIENSFYWSIAMFKNYFKIAVRNLLKYKVFSFINISGLALGIASCIVVFLFVQDELSWDKFHENADRIYRVAIERKTPAGTINRTQLTRSRIAQALKEEYPKVVNAVKFGVGRGLTNYGEKQFEERIYYVDPSFLEIFTFPLIKGDKKTVLNEPFTAVITEDMAKKYFGNEEPVGKILTLDGEHDFKITGILKNIPYNSSIRNDFFASYPSMKSVEGEDNILFKYDLNNVITFILLRNDASVEEFEEKLHGFMIKQWSEDIASKSKYYLQPLTSIHLHSNIPVNIYRNSDIKYSYTYSAIALIILLIACVNFINLSTARASRRFREVGIRKVVGANRFQLIRQFLCESIIMAFLALVIANVLAFFFLPYFNTYTSRQLVLGLGNNQFLYIGLFLITIFVGFVAGSYPAFFASSFKPLDIIKSNKLHGSKGAIVRKGLVVFQFAISIVFIIGTIVVLSQINFIKNKDLGFDKNNVVLIDIIDGKTFMSMYETIKSELLAHPNVKNVTASRIGPGRTSGAVRSFTLEGFPEDEPMDLHLQHFCYDFFDFYGIEIVYGRGFSKEIPTDVKNALILNETAVKKIGWDSPIGKSIKGTLIEGTVIGVVKDYHNDSLHDEIKPMVFQYYPDYFMECSVRISPNDILGTIAFLEEKWRKFSPEVGFDYSFLDDYIAADYKEEERTNKVFIFASTLSIFLACLGLFGLSTFSAERRVKEIGIRRALGATVPGIVLLLSKDFAKLVLAANVIAWPVAYLIMDRWLQNFAYKVNIGWWVFVLAGILTLAIALITISYQSIKAATANPIDSLRFE